MIKVTDLLEKIKSKGCYTHCGIDREKLDLIMFKVNSNYINHPELGLCVELDDCKKVQNYIQYNYDVLVPIEEEEVKTYTKGEFQAKLSELSHPLALPEVNPWQVRRSLYCTKGVKFPHPDEYGGFIIPNDEETLDAIEWLKKHKVIK